MSIMDFECRHSFSVPPYSLLPCENPDLLFLGCGYQTFLYAELSSCVGLRRMREARLILFKIPDGNERCRCDRYWAYPLLEFFSEYGYLFSPPNTDDALGAAFFDDPNRCNLEIDMTAIVRAWLEGEIENKGVLLTGGQNTHLITCASDRHEGAGMRPFLRIVCDEIVICRPLSALRCAVSLDF